jgi:hypothetical protein
MKPTLKALVTLVFCGLSILAAKASSTPIPDQSPDGIEFFEKKVRPILTANCYACHSAQVSRPKGGLLLDTREGMLKGGASGSPVIVPGDVEKSLLIKAVRYSDLALQMPPVGKLPPEQIQDLETWIRMGAPDPRIASARPANWQPYDFAAARKFWSFQPVKDAQPPAVRNAAWVKSPIDSFILARLDEKGLKPAGDADRRTLIRRATFDLTGLPPTPDEIDAFVRDASPGAFERVIDRLLASPAYGERWGRHWLDIVRYADTAGDNSDFPVPAAFRYRDYVIKSFNEDKPYDQFVREQIAGDLMPAKTEFEKNEHIIATGYLALSRRFGSRNAEFNLTIDDTIDNLGKAFLGLSVSCARCHDHKFDPIPNSDYYALYGILNSSRYSFPGAEIYPHPADMVALVSGKRAESFYKQQQELSDIDDQKERLQTEKGVAARNKRLKESKESKPSADAPVTGENTNKQAAPKPVEAKNSDEPKLRTADYDRDDRNHKIAQASSRMPEEVDADVVRLMARLEELHERPVQVEKAYAVVEGNPSNTRIHLRGDPTKLGDEVPRGFLTILGGARVPQDYKGSGRDLLAGWIVDPANPLTARVMANRIWQYHFGRGLVATPNDFGARGKEPTNLPLLDYLAARFREGDWSIKKMHRMIMLSHTYQMASVESNGSFAANAAVDVGNDYLWRFNRRRLEAEELRDAVLSISGLLDRSPGGEHAFPPETTWRFTQHEQFFAVYETNRRSVYVMQQRLKKHPFFAIFDGPDQNAITGERFESTTPIQALYFMNSPLMHEAADQLAVRVGMAFETTAARLNFAYRLALGRSPTADEQREAASYLAKVRTQLVTAGVPTERLTRDSLASYLRVVLSSNELLYLD